MTQPTIDWIDKDGQTHGHEFSTLVDQAMAANKHGSYKHNGVERANIPHLAMMEEDAPEPDRIQLMADAVGAVFRFCWGARQANKLPWKTALMRFAAITLAVRPDLLPMKTNAKTIAVKFRVKPAAVSIALSKFGREVGLHLNLRKRGACEKFRHLKLHRSAAARDPQRTQGRESTVRK